MNLNRLKVPLTTSPDSRPFETTREKTDDLNQYNLKYSEIKKTLKANSSIS